MSIPTLSNAKLKAFAKLHDKKYRDEERLFIAEGNRTVAEILSRPNSASSLVALILRESIDMFDIAGGFVQKTFMLPEPEFNRLATTETPQDVIGIFHQPIASFSETLSRLASKNESLVVLLDGLQDAGNVGTIVRTAAWFGADMILANRETADFFNPKAVRSSAGSLFAVPLIRNEHFIREIETLKENGYVLSVAALNGEAVTPNNLPKKIGLVIGNEGRGVSESVIKLADKTFTIVGNQVESLNAAVAAGILMAMYRQA